MNVPLLGLPLPDFDLPDELSPPDFDVAPDDPLISPPPLTLPDGCDPDFTFTALTLTGLSYDSAHPIYETQTSTLYAARDGDSYFALKTSRRIRILRHEWEVFQRVGPFRSVIGAVAFWEEGGRGFLQLELALGGAITRCVPFLSPNHAWQLLADISSALACLHACGFVHLDLSPANILHCGLPGDAVYKLADFGTVTAVGSSQSFGEGAGPYIAPEVLSSRADIGFASDIWSLGAVMFEIVARRPMPRDHDPDGYIAMRDGTYDMSVVPDEFAVVTQMLAPHPGSRPTVAQLLEIPRVRECLATSRQIKAAGLDGGSVL
jgi:serine/threonine protein kinase